MGFKQILFPQTSREIPGKRYISLTLRGLHLVGVAGVAGLFLFQLPFEQWRIYGLMALASGVLMMAMEIWGDGVWLFQLRGQAVLLKLVLLVLALIWPASAAINFIIIVLLSAFFSHAPGKIRYYSIWHGEVVKALRTADGRIRNSGQR
ncbi:hypothetical protein [Marinobacterium mangrovicola]|uniref:Uncharacterized protein n=1 Tax=Marinobacterium mangrovicola TaxID=1476959 RepID=A0A4V2PDL5_9GAMM|nr:hypothetical protein [Marinobacterium mangrovicola]TCK05626.1 hypothetical protein CLV83_2554 [Marinobacterium mangrovicola]